MDGPGPRPPAVDRLAVAEPPVLLVPVNRFMVSFAVACDVIPAGITAPCPRPAIRKHPHPHAPYARRRRALAYARKRRSLWSARP
ncbi:hypothetical protein SMICM17S_12534 [Streptomyces microflavus]